MERETAIMGLTFMTFICALAFGFYQMWRTEKDKRENVHSALKVRHDNHASVGDAKTPSA